MNRDYNENFEDNGDATLDQSVKRFENMLRNNESHYLDEVTYETLSNFYLDKGEWDMALKACSLGLEQFPYSLELILNRVQLHINIAEYDEALEMIDRAATFFPADQETLYMKGVVLNLTGEHDAAIEILSTALHLSDQKDEIYFQLAQIYQNKNDFNKAFENYKLAIELGYDNELIFYEMVLCLEFEDKLEESLPYLKALTDKDPYSHLAWFCYGLACSRLKKFPEAIEALDFSVVVKDDFASGWFNLAHCYVNVDDYQRAKEAYLKTATLEEPSAELYTCLGSSCEKLDDYPGAFQNYKKATALDEAWDEAWYGMASVLYEQEKFIEALHFAEKAINLDDLNADYWLLKADIEARLGNAISSIEAYTKAADQDPENIDIWLNWSLLHFEQKEYQTAFEIIHGALKDFPKEADLSYRAAVYLIFCGSYHEAYQFLQDALLLDFDSHDQIYSFFPSLKTQKALNRIIEQNRPEPK